MDTAPGRRLRGHARFLSLLLCVVCGACHERARITSVPDSQPAATINPPAPLADWYNKREVYIPMRDGVRLFTAIYTPIRPSGPSPILIKRTPYSVGPYGAGKFPEYLGPSSEFNQKNYIFVYQDVRGRNMSEGEFANMRPFVPLKRTVTDIDENSDTYDTIEWLLANVPGHNGRVGMHGISYPGFYCSMAAIQSHPALVAVSPQAPVADWYFDDFRHHGAFFLPHAYGFMAVFDRPRTSVGVARPPSFQFPTPEGYAYYMKMGSLRNATDAEHLGKNVTFWPELVAHENYDEFWQARNILPHLRGVRSATMVVGGWYDAEDLYGTFNTYQAIERQNEGNFNVLVVGPWSHGGWARTHGDKLGDVQFGGNTGDFYRTRIETEFFCSLLENGKRPDLPEAYVFETGDNRWRTFDAWPPKGVRRREMYLSDDHELTWSPPQADGVPFDEFWSDPSLPVPYTQQISTRMVSTYMTEDQRFAARRPDVLSFQTAPLREEVTMAGPLVADLWVSTSGTDSDWIVKLIDVFPWETGEERSGEDDFSSRKERDDKSMSNYHMLVRSEVFRGRFREGYAVPKPFVPNQPTRVQVPLQDVLHSFGRGHRIMVQIQSTWFPLVDRNPQTFVASVSNAHPGDFVKAMQRVHHSSTHPTRLVFSELN